MTEIEEGLPAVVEQNTLAILNKSEIDQQIATAKQYPRSVVKFRKEALEMVTLNERVAESCIYALPRDGKTIEGPSARFAEIIHSAWNNSRAGARIVSEQGDFVTAQGVFHDLERNSAITYEVQRRIVDRHGRRYKPDMVTVTGNAACSIALRNAILKGIPKAFWDDMYEAARATVMGDYKSLNNRRADALKAFLAYGVTADQICATLGVSGVEDIGLDHIVTLRGMLTAIKDGDTTPEQAFGQPENGNKPAVRPPESKSDQNRAQQGPQHGAHMGQPTNGEPRETEPSPAPEADKTMFSGGLARKKEADGHDNGNGNGKGNGGSLATDGEKTFLTGKIKGLGLEVQDVMDTCGIDSFSSLTADEFIRVKKYVTEQARV